MFYIGTIHGIGVPIRLTIDFGSDVISAMVNYIV